MQAFCHGLGPLQLKRGFRAGVVLRFRDVCALPTLDAVSNGCTHAAHQPVVCCFFYHSSADHGSAHHNSLLFFFNRNCKKPKQRGPHHHNRISAGQR